jgi:glyoxylase-like metal-dependent hydrolase (beta-lactamase superfamily II)/ferredoxin
MASLRKINSQNHAGSVFTDTSCIDCGTCYHLAPEIFDEIQGSSVVISQPHDLDQWSEVKRAIVSCPTNSIGIREHDPGFRSAALNLPLPIDENVFYCGYTAESSFGATTYFIERPEGNILIDSPRFHPQLVKELEKRGGVAMMILSHRDDVADHQLYYDHFKCQRVIHEDELSSSTQSCEHILRGHGDWELSPELKIIKVPGHTKGHVVILYKNKFLFTGDHLFVDKNTITASQGVCWYSWTEQIKSTKKLLKYDFEWVLPGHGGWVQFADAKSSLQNLIDHMEK